MIWGVGVWLVEVGQCLYLKNVIAVLIFGIKKGLIFEKGEWF